MLLTDVIVTRELPHEARESLHEIGLAYLCEATQADFRSWMVEAAFRDVVVEDLTDVVRPL